MPDRPHILMLVSDEHSPRYTSYEGHSCVRTPHLQRLHDEGVNCSSAYCNSPICAPSRASQISGRYCRNCGVTDWFQDLYPGIPTCPAISRIKAKRPSHSAKCISMETR